MLIILVVSSWNTCYVILFLCFGRKCLNLKCTLVAIVFVAIFVNLPGLKMPGEVIKKENGTEATHFIPRFSSSLLLVKGFLYHSILFFWPKFFLEKSFLLSAEGELLVDKAWPGVLRDGKVGGPGSIKIHNYIYEIGKNRFKRNNKSKVAVTKFLFKRHPPPATHQQ